MIVAVHSHGRTWIKTKPNVYALYILIMSRSLRAHNASWKIINNNALTKYNNYVNIYNYRR